MRRSEIRVVLGEHTSVFFEGLPHADEALIGDWHTWHLLTAI